MSNHYEVIFILNSTQNEEEVSTTSDRIKALISKHEGTIIKEENWGLLNLAYEIRKQPKGRYMLFFFSALPSVVADLEKNFNVMENVIKYMTLRLDKHQIEAYHKKAAKDKADKAAAEARKAEAEAAEAEAKAAESETPPEPEPAVPEPATPEPAVPEPAVPEPEISSEAAPESEPTAAPPVEE